MIRREFIKEYQGNLLDEFDKQDSELDMIAHGANCFNLMGAGIAKQIKERYPDVYFTDKHYCLPVGSIERLGNINRGQDNEVYNIYTQYRPGANADYSALRIGLRKLNYLFKNEKRIQTLGLPLIGCGIGGLEWSQVKNIILEEITDMNIHIVHYNTDTLEKIPFTAQEFNDKWKYHLEIGFENQGLMINNKKVCVYLDNVFRKIEKIINKNFKYSQIKIEFGSPRVYMTNVNKHLLIQIENKIYELLMEKNN